MLIQINVIISCIENKQNAPKIKTLESVAEKALNQKLYIPDSLDIYIPFPNCLKQKEEMLNTKFQIYSKVDASCGTCIGEINSWNELIHDFSIYNVPIFLICSSDDNFELIKYFCESSLITDFGYPIFFDKKNEFVKENEFMAIDKNFETVLIDKNGNIIALGNPVHSKGIKEIYLNEIQKRLSE